MSERERLASLILNVSNDTGPDVAWTKSIEALAAADRILAAGYTRENSEAVLDPDEPIAPVVTEAMVERAAQVICAMDEGYDLHIYRKFSRAALEAALREAGR